MRSKDDLKQKKKDQWGMVKGRQVARRLRGKRDKTSGTEERKQGPTKSSYQFNGGGRGDKKCSKNRKGEIPTCNLETEQRRGH